MPPPVKRERVARLIAEGAEQTRRFREQRIGQVETVLFERLAEGAARGLTDTYIPVRARCRPGDADPVNEIAPVRITGIDEGVLIGEVAR